MAYIDCDKCSHGIVCAYRHQYDDPAPKPAQPMGSFDTDDFFEAALARSQERGMI